MNDFPDTNKNVNITKYRIAIECDNILLIEKMSMFSFKNGRC